MAIIKGIVKFIKQLKKNKIDYYDIPEKITNNIDFINAAIENGVMHFGRRGYDVINNQFFVETAYTKSDGRPYKEKTYYFKTFEEYYNFVNDDIYDNSCYYQYEFNKKQIKKMRLDIERLSSDHFIDYTIDDWIIESGSENESKGEIARKKELHKWLDKLISCKNGEAFYDVYSKYHEAGYWENVYSQFIIDQFIAKTGDRAFNVLIDYINRSQDQFVTKILVFRYGYEKVIPAYAPDPSEKIISKRKKELKEFEDRVKGNCEVNRKTGFSEMTQSFCIKDGYIYHGNKRLIYEDVRFFDLFDEFSSYLKNEKSKDKTIDAMLSNFIISNNEKMLVDSNGSHYKVSTNIGERFEVVKTWYDNKRHLIGKQRKRFKYFADFAYFLHYDLSGSDFLSCDGIINLICNDLCQEAT